jgi:predicted enzyme related to lactoylglutathione lyase
MAADRDGLDVRDRRRGSRRFSTAHLLVDDFDAFLAGLAERGITTGPVDTVGDAVRRTVVTDPDGNRLQVGQPPT